MKQMSLSMVLGMPMMAILRLRLVTSSKMARPGFHGAVAADDEEHVDVAALQGVDDLAGILRPAGGAEHRAAEKMDVPYLVRGELDVTVPVFRNEALEAEGNAEDAGHVVVMVGFHDNGADDVVQSGAQAAARDDGRLGAQGVKVKVPARACGFEFQGSWVPPPLRRGSDPPRGDNACGLPTRRGGGGFDFAGPSTGMLVSMLCFSCSLFMECSRKKFGRPDQRLWVSAAGKVWQKACRCAYSGPGRRKRQSLGRKVYTHMKEASLCAECDGSVAPQRA